MTAGEATRASRPAGFWSRLRVRLDDYQQRHRWVGLPLAVIYKFIDDQGTYLAALITYYGFVSLFPLLLLLVTVLSYVLQSDAGLQHAVLNSALRDFPVIGQQIGENVHSLRGNLVALGIGVVGALYGGLGVTVAGQNAMNTAWAVPRNLRPDPFVARARGLLLLGLLGVGVLVTTGLSAVTTTGPTSGPGLNLLVRVVAGVVAVVLNAALFTVAFRVLTTRNVSVREIRLGAILAAVAWQVLQELGTYYVAHELNGVSATYGLFGIVLGLLAWIYLGALVVVFCAEINVVRAERLWPRSLLTPFTDKVVLTGADQRAYTFYAAAERQKGFETVHVDFAAPPHDHDQSRSGDGERSAEPDRAE